MNPRDWIKIYEKRHPPSPREYQRLEFQTPILVKPGQVVVLYIHSTLQGDEAIVYDNLRPRPNQRGREPIMRHFRNAPPPANQRVPVLDRCVEILPARAHVSNVPFGSRPIWGWGFAWRDDREFVGRIEYGCVYRLWNPTCHVRFATRFNKAVQTMLLCQRRDESQMSRLPDDCIYYILNMCRWDWFNDGLEEYQQARRQRLSHRRVSNAQQMMEAASASFEQAEADPPAVAAARRCDRMRTSSSSNVAMATERQLSEGDIDVDDEDVDDDDDDDGDFVEDDDDDDNNDEDDDEDEEEDEEDEESEAGTVNGNFFRINAASDDEGDDGNQDNGNNNDEHDEDDDETSRAWIRRQFARLHVLRALAAMEDNADVEMNS